MKPIYKSKTVIFNAITIITVFAALFGYAPNEELAETTASILIGLSPIINIILRLMTDKGISMPTIELREEK